MNYCVVFVVSLICISLELLFTRLLNFKTWNHVVYTVIPFAILGVGIGANLVLLRKEAFFALDPRPILGRLLMGLSVLIILVSGGFIGLPIKVDYLVNFSKSLTALGMLALAYTLFMLPFIFIGFIIVYLFRRNSAESHKLYAADLIGAGLGAVAFFFMIGSLELFHSLLITALLAFAAGAWLFMKNKNPVIFILSFLIIGGVMVVVPEPVDYQIDDRKGWEWIPGYFRQDKYDQISTRWHSLGRTDIYRMKDPQTRAEMATAQFTFALNVDPLPEFSYFSTNFLSGTPVFRYSDLYKPGSIYSMSQFAVLMEAPYVLMKDIAPRVFVIGAGGARDIFMAQSHNASNIIGAEVNPEIVRAMSKGGVMYEYSARMYDNARVYPLDARHVVKTIPAGTIDYVILNGVDTFSGLSSGAYAYAESYLYTKEAIKDYIKVLDKKGIVCFNRWLWNPPRETLRLQAIALEALKESGITDPLEHLFVGTKDTWSMTLIRKSPFTPEERALLVDYFRKFKGRVLYPSEVDRKIVGHPNKAFDEYAEAYRQGTHKEFEKKYSYDISVSTDDKPFFYKYYRFHWKDMWQSDAAQHHTGPVIFWTQFLVLMQAFVFIVLFILVPLVRFKKEGLLQLRGAQLNAFVVYFASLGLGYMFIEIPLMQKFVLLLGSPIHAISVILAGLLFWTGVGSLLFPGLASRSRLSNGAFIAAAGLCVVVLMLGATQLAALISGAMTWSFPARSALTVGLLAPVGVVLGVFFPAGLAVVPQKDSSLIAWAWGINCGFSVLASMLAIIIAQFVGFNAVLMLSGIIYLIGVAAYRVLAKPH